MTEEEVKKLKDGDYVEVKIGEDIYLGPVYQLSDLSTETFLVDFYTEVCISKSEWNLEILGIKPLNIKKSLPNLMSIDDQIKKFYPQYLI
jgi:hypothetical protein